MLQATVRRIRPLIPIERVFVITGRDLEPEVRKQLPDLPENNLVGEPVGKNTAAAVGLSAALIGRSDENATILVLPSDHLVFDESKFLACLSTAAQVALERKSLVVFGIKPDRIETGYGYIKAGAEVDRKVYEVEAFVEKPDEARAKDFLTEGSYYWNSGMFMWTYPVIMEAIEKHMPVLFRNLQKIKNVPAREVIEEVYSQLENISIDYGVMEKAENRVMVMGDFKWDDVGSWLAMERVWDKDGEGNASHGKFVGIDTHDSVIMSDKALVSTIGISNMIIVATGDAVLICPKERAQEVKKMVKKLVDVGEKRYVE